jgi:hypothetical protein
MIKSFYVPEATLREDSADACHRYVEFARDLRMAGLADRFPSDAEVRHNTVEMLAERYRVAELVDQPSIVADAIVQVVTAICERDRLLEQ